MIAIFLAAGEGKRLRPLTNTTPKPMIKIFGKPILEYSLESVYSFVSEIIIVVKYKSEEIKSYFGDEYKGKKISYLLQGEQKGTGAAIREIPLKKDDLIILNGDSIFDDTDLRMILDYVGYGCLVKEVDTPEKYGIFVQNKHGYASNIVEKPKEYVGNLANLGVYKVNTDILEISRKIPLSPRGEYEITDSVNEFINHHDFSLFPISGHFIDVGYPWDILQANQHFSSKVLQSVIHGEIESNVVIKGNIILGKGSVLKSGTYIEGNVYIGNNTTVGPNAYLRGSVVIGNNCHIGNAVELKNTHLGDGSHVPHLSYIGDSVIGNNVNIGGGFITANLRHDNKNIKVKINDELIQTSMRKLGVIIGDNAKTGIKNMTYPGRVIESNSFTLPGKIIK